MLTFSGDAGSATSFFFALRDSLRMWHIYVTFSFHIAELASTKNQTDTRIVNVATTQTSKMNLVSW